MIYFACKKLDIEEVMRCGLGITKTEQLILKFLLKKEWCTANKLVTELNISLATTQRSLKNLHEKQLVDRHQQNLDKGGYLFIYKAKDKEKIKIKLKNILKEWINDVENSLEKW